MLLFIYTYNVTISFRVNGRPYRHFNSFFLKTRDTILIPSSTSAGFTFCPTCYQRGRGIWRDKTRAVYTHQPTQLGIVLFVGKSAVNVADIYFQHWGRIETEGQYNGNAIVWSRLGVFFEFLRDSSFRAKLIESSHTRVICMVLRLYKSCQLQNFVLEQRIMKSCRYNLIEQIS